MKTELPSPDEARTLITLWLHRNVISPNDVLEIYAETQRAVKDTLRTPEGKLSAEGVNRILCDNWRQLNDLTDNAAKTFICSLLGHDTSVEILTSAGTNAWTQLFIVVPHLSPVAFILVAPMTAYPGPQISAHYSIEAGSASHGVIAHLYKIAQVRMEGNPLMSDRVDQLVANHRFTVTDRGIISVQ